MSEWVSDKVTYRAVWGQLKINFVKQIKKGEWASPWAIQLFNPTRPLALTGGFKMTAKAFLKMSYSMESSKNQPSFYQQPVLLPGPISPALAAPPRLSRQVENVACLSHSCPDIIPSATTFSANLMIMIMINFILIIIFTSGLSLLPWSEPRDNDATIIVAAFSLWCRCHIVRWFFNHAKNQRINQHPLPRQSN